MKAWNTLSRIKEGYFTTLARFRNGCEIKETKN
jgi:hypothetical protein